MSELATFTEDLSFVRDDPAQAPGWQTHRSEEADGNETHACHELSLPSARTLYRPQWPQKARARKLS